MVTASSSTTRPGRTHQRSDLISPVSELVASSAEASVRELRIDGMRTRRISVGAARLHPRLLIIHSNPFRADVLATILAPLRLECHHAASHWTAVRWLEENPSASLVAVDPSAPDCLGLPGFLLRQQPGFPLVALFTTTDDVCESNALRLGAAAVLGYPCPPEELRAAVAGALLIRGSTRAEPPMGEEACTDVKAIDRPVGEIELDRQSSAADTLAADQHGIRPLKQALHDYECLQIFSALQILRWNRNDTAKALGIERTTLYLKMKKYGLLEPNSDSQAADADSAEGAD